jgi:hypothetical protein
LNSEQNVKTAPLKTGFTKRRNISSSVLMQLVNN